MKSVKGQDHEVHSSDSGGDTDIDAVLLAEECCDRLVCFKECKVFVPERASGQLLLSSWV